MSAAFRDAVAAISKRLPGAELSDPSGGELDAWKVGGKMFACFGSVDPGVSVKCDSIETAEMLKEAGLAQNAKYFHKSWVRLPEEIAPDELVHRIVTSYDIVRAGLPAGLKRALPPRSEEA